MQGIQERRLIFIDASGVIFRSFYALPALTQPDGTPVGAVVGFLNLCLKYLEVSSYWGLGFVFDVGRQTFRQDIDPRYKANRPKIPDDLSHQFSLIRQACHVFDWPILEASGFEADDVLATYANHASNQGFSVTIISSDKDLMQLVSQGGESRGEVCLYDPVKQKMIQTQDVLEKFGVPPEKVPDVQALMGDSSDNIQGVPGIGAKTAAALIQEFGSVDRLLQNIHKLASHKKRELLQRHRDQLLIAQKLVTLRYDVPLSLSLEDLKRKAYSVDQIESFLKSHNFSALLTRFKKNHSFGNLDIGCSYVLIRDLTVLESWVQRAKKRGVISIILMESVACEGLAFAVGPGEAAYVAFQDFRYQELWDCLRCLFQDSTVLKVGYNLKAIWLDLLNQKIKLDRWEDILILFYVLNGIPQSSTLEGLLEAHMGHIIQNTGELREAEKADFMLQFYFILRNRLQKTNIKSIYEKCELPLMPILIGMESAGVAINPQIFKDLSTAFQEKMSVIQDTIYQLSGLSFNIASPQQVGHVLFEHLGLPGGEKQGKTKTYGTGADILEALAVQGYELPKKILEWRHFAKLKNTYSDALLKQINPQTERIHTTYLMTSTATGRLSSIDPNLQNIPIRVGGMIRKAFIAPPGYRLVSLDYSQIELRLLAHMGHILSLQEAFHNQEDIHSKTASEIFHVPLGEVTAAMRRQAKVINFGIIYGMSPYGFSQKLGISPQAAQKQIQDYFQNYPGIEDYMKEQKEKARDKGFVETCWGRRCYISGIHDRNLHVRAGAERQAINAPLQGGSADIIKFSMIAIDALIKERHFSARLLLQVHDELVFEILEDQLEMVVPLLQDTMANIVSLSVPLKVDLGIGDNWSEAHPEGGQSVSEAN